MEAGAGLPLCAALVAELGAADTTGGSGVGVSLGARWGWLGGRGGLRDVVTILCLFDGLATVVAGHPALLSGQLLQRCNVQVFAGTAASALVVEILAMGASDLVALIAVALHGLFVDHGWQDDAAAAWAKQSLGHRNGVFDLLSLQVLDEVGRKVLVCRLGDRPVAAAGWELCFLQRLAEVLLQAILAEGVAAPRHEDRGGREHFAADETFNRCHLGHFAWPGLACLLGGVPPLSDR